MRIRNSARGIVFNAAGEIMLLRCEDLAPVDPRNPALLKYWVTPGGGTKEGETSEQSLLRELHEEAGLVGVEVGDCVWIRELELHLERGPVMSRERYYLCRSPQIQFTSEHMTESERAVIKDIRWWSLDQLAASNETFRPPGLFSLVSSIVVDGPPRQPIRIVG
jgi:8-oxo-dGTP pyrophosphatase MutT (NUDIX family)